MQQRQLRLGDILDDYCPRERRVTNHAVVAMIGEEVKRTRCTTCDAEHEYKHAKVPRQRKKSESPAALYAQVAANAPKRVAHDPTPNGASASAPDQPDQHDEHDEQGEHDEHGERGARGEIDQGETAPLHEGQSESERVEASVDTPSRDDGEREEPGGLEATNDADLSDEDRSDEDGPVHRPLIRASLPRPEGQQPPQRPLPEFTIRQPGGRPGRFRPRHQRGGGHQGHHQGPQGHQSHHHGQGQQYQGNRSNINQGGPTRGGQRPNSGRPGMMKRQGPPGRKRSK